MPMTKFSRGNFLHAIGNRAVRQAISALGLKASTSYELSAPSGAANGLNGTNRVRNSNTLVAEVNLSVDVAGGGLFYWIHGVLPAAIPVTQGAAFDFGASTAVVQAGTMGGAFVFYGATTAAGTGGNLATLTTANSTVAAATLVTVDFMAQFSEPGQVSLRFAQQVAGASNTDILPGAFLCAIPLDHTPESA